MKTSSNLARRAFLQLTATIAAMPGLSGCAGVTITPEPRVRPPRPIPSGAKMGVTDAPELNQFPKPTFRPGWATWIWKEPGGKTRKISACRRNCATARPAS